MPACLQGGGGRTVEQRLSKVLHLGGFQTGKLNQGQRLEALQRTQQLAQLIAGLVGTVCDEEQAAPPE